MSKFTTYDFVAFDRNMVASGKGYSWRSYTDRVGKFGSLGAEVIFDDGSKGKDGKPIGKGFSINQSHYKLQAREGHKDVSGKQMVDYFKYAPFCYGSPNGEYYYESGEQVPLEDLEKIPRNLERLKSGEIKQVNVKIKLLDNESDAKMALETGLKRAQAQLSVGQIDEQTLTEIAAMIGEFNKPEQSLRLAVYEYAGKRPVDYFRLLESGDRALRALVRLAINKGVLTEKGQVIYWKETVVGGDENAAVSYLLGDKSQLKALQDAVDFKTDKKKK